jgi:exopolysaccharide/PEP-CTERM locus tyrosine autokinase
VEQAKPSGRRTVSKIEQILEKATALREGGKLVEEITQKPLQTPVYSSFKAESKVLVTNPYLVTVTDPTSPATEEYQKLKSVVVKLTNGSKFLNTLMVTSTLGGEGKSITSLNLAISLAQEYDHTVLLVDADLRRSSATEYLGFSSELGLTDCVMHGADFSKALIKTGIGKLSILPAGRKVSNPVEILSSRRMKDFLQELKQRYPDRYVIIDTPPVLYFAEAHAIASVVDGVLFVVREGQVPIQNLKEALNMLKDANILGVIYNGSEMNRFNSYHYYHNYYSGYKRTEANEN